MGEREEDLILYELQKDCSNSVEDGSPVARLHADMDTIQSLRVQMSEEALVEIVAIVDHVIGGHHRN
jgi:hypothetical protein